MLGNEAAVDTAAAAERNEKKRKKWKLLKSL